MLYAGQVRGESVGSDSHTGGFKVFPRGDNIVFVRPPGEVSCRPITGPESETAE